jgi:glycosyltransferase involved in cell wall biosynthesis
MTAKPSEDFALTYFGKETVFGLVKSILDAGIKVKAFGGKLSIVPKKLMEHPNLDHVGKISDKELMRLYSNALFTFYPFTDEPFGYIPIESLACGTPVLTYNRQGPKETIINGDTGWLADDDETLLKLASRIWKNGFPRKTRETCRKSALKYDASAIAGKWFEMLDNVYA